MLTNGDLANITSRVQNVKMKTKSNFARTFGCILSGTIMDDSKEVIIFMKPYN